MRLLFICAVIVATDFAGYFAMIAAGYLAVVILVLSWRMAGTINDWLHEDDWLTS